MAVVRSGISFVTVFKWSQTRYLHIVCTWGRTPPRPHPCFAAKFVCFSVCKLCFNKKVKRNKRNIWGRSQKCWVSWTNRLEAVLKTTPQTTWPAWPTKAITAAAAPGDIWGQATGTVAPESQGPLLQPFPSRLCIDFSSSSRWFTNSRFKWVHLTDGAWGQMLGNLFPEFPLRGDSHQKAGNHNKDVQKVINSQKTWESPLQHPS